MRERREEVLDEARRWVGTPYRHQKRLCQVGVDCIGLVWGVGERAGVLTVDPAMAKQFLGYSRLPSPPRFMRALDTFFRPVDSGDAEPGDIAVMAWDGGRLIPQHLGILAERDGRPMLIHAESVVGRCVEHGFVGEWPGRVCGWYRYPGLIDGNGNL